MRPHEKLAVALIFCIGVFIPPQVPSAGAVTAADWRASRIIEDGLFSSVDMSVADIQNFLVTKVPACDTQGTRPASEYGRSDLTHAQYAASKGWAAPPYVCLRDFYEVPKIAPGPGVPLNSYDNGGNPPLGSISAAQMIYDAAIKYNISPRVLLVKLDTESAGPLTRDMWPLRQQYTYAMGAHVPDGGPNGEATPDTNYAGFSIQIAESARLLRYYLNNMQQPWWDNKRPFEINNILWNVIQSGCGGSNIYLENKSTTALYVYTPYQPNQAALNNMYGKGDGCSAYGNRNFWRVWNDWFGRSSGSVLVQAPSSNTVYLLTQNKRFAIPSGDILYAYGLQSVRIEAVSDQFIANTDDGGMLSTLFTTPGDGTVYLADGGRKNGIASGEYCTMWGLDCANPNAVKVIGPEIANNLIPNQPLQAIMRFSGQYYLMQDGKKQPFLSAKAAQERGYDVSQSTTVINWTNAIRPFGAAYPENNSFVKIAAAQAIYLYSQGKFYALPDFATFLNWFGVSGIAVLDSQSSYNLTPPAVAGTLRSIVKKTDGSFAAIGKTQLLGLPNAKSTAERYTDLSTMIDAQSYLQLRSASNLESGKAVAIPDGTILSFKNNELRAIPSMTDLRLQYTDADIKVAPQDITAFYPIGKLDIVPGRVVRPAETGGSMYIYGADKRLWALGSLAEVYAINRWSNGAISARLADIDASEIKIYSRLISFSGGTYAVRDDGSVQAIPTAILNSTPTAMPLAGPMEKFIPINSVELKFIRFDNGTIFAISADSIRPLSSLSTYFALGGNAANTIGLPLKSVSSFKVGSVL